MSTEPAPAPGSRPGPRFDLDASWRLSPQVALRPERFGTLLYHFGTRRLSFLKNRALLDVVRALDTQLSARTACAAAGITPDELPRFTKALEALAASGTIQPRSKGEGPA